MKGNQIRYNRTRLLLRLLAVASLMISIHQACGWPGDGHWDRQFNMPGTGTRDYAIRFNGNLLYAGGYSLTTNAALSSSTIVNVFDGTNWTTIGDISGGSGLIEDFGFLGGKLYVGGVFSRAGGVRTGGLAQWDGLNWSSVGGALPAIVYTIASDGTNLYVGGNFTNAPGITNFGKWDGTNWSAVGGPIGYYTASLSPAVNAIAWNQGKLYIAGNFTNAGNVAATNLACWDGNSWSAVGGGIGGLSDVVQSIQFLGNDLYVAGQFASAGGVAALNIAKWNGSNWSPLGSGLKAAPNVGPYAPGNAAVNAIAFLGTDLYATGNFTNAGGLTATRVARWDGAAWYNLGGLNGFGVRAISNSGSMYFCGTFNLAGNVIGNHVVRWDGANWYGINGKPANGTHLFVQGLSMGADGLYMGGFFSAVGSTVASRIARYDGTSWYPLGDGLTTPLSGNLDVRTIKAMSGVLYAGGDFSAAGGVLSSNVASWDGYNWSALGSGVDGTVNAIDGSPGDVYIGGSFLNAWYYPGFGVSANRIVHWDGYSWTPLGAGLNNTVGAICAAGGNVYVGGSFTTADGNTANRIAMWNGSSWSSLGTGTANGVSSTVMAILADGTDIYVGGQFTNAGTVVVRGIAKWDGSTWSGLGQGAFGTSTAAIRALAKVNGYLYAAGTFTNIGGNVSYNIARWDGAQWQNMGSGIGVNTAGARGYALASSGNDIYVAGIFEDAGGSDAGYVAHWNDQIDFTPPCILRLSNPQMLTGNNFAFRVNTTEHPAYIVEYSSDLKSWTPFTTNALGLLDLTNSVQGVNLRTYRLREIP